MVGKVEAAVDPDTLQRDWHIVLGIGRPEPARGDPLALHGVSSAQFSSARSAVSISIAAEGLHLCALSALHDVDVGRGVWANRGSDRRR